MVHKARWLAALLPIIFLGLICWTALKHDPYFWRSSLALYKLAQEADKRGELPQALPLAEKAWAKNPRNSDVGTFLGRLYIKAGQQEKGLEVLQQVWLRDDQAVAALRGQAQVLVDLGRRQQALDFVADLLKKQPDNCEILAVAAELASLSEEDRPLAASYYQRLYQLRPDPRVRQKLIELLTGLNRFKEAIPLQEEEVSQSPGSPEALHRLALLHYWLRDYQAAGQIYQRLLEKCADNHGFREEAAQAAEAAQNLDEALKHYLWLYARHQGKKEYALKLARLWARKGNHAEAVAVLAPLMQGKPEADVQRWYALEVLLTGDFDKALKTYRSAWEAGDTHQETIINLARLYGRSQQFAKAAGFWDEARRRQLVQGELRWEAALAYSYAHRYGEAVDILQPVERDNPKHPRIQAFLGQLHFYQKHWGIAAQYFRKYLEKHPEDLEVRRLLAEALAFKKDARDEAIDAYGELTKRVDDAAVRLRKAALLLEAQRWEEARQELAQCQAPQDPRLRREQARLYLWLGDLEESRKHYEDYLAREPGDREALLEQARVLTYLGRSREAGELLRRLQGEAAGQGTASPEARAVLAASIEASLAGKNWQEAARWALKLYSIQFPNKGRPARTWREACDWHEEARLARLNGKAELKVVQVGFQDELETEAEEFALLTLEERTWIARALYHGEDVRSLNLAADLLVDNLWKNRYHHPSLIILGAILPRLPRYEDLSRLVYRIPGIKVGSPEYVASLAFFSSNLGRQGGKLDYLLHVLREYREHKKPKNPGELLALAHLATEVGERRLAEDYYRRALRLKPDDERIAQLLLNCHMSQKEWDKALASLNKNGLNADNAMDAARVYLVRGQYEGVKAAVAVVPENHPERDQALLLLAQVCRLERNFPEALKTLEQLKARIPAETWLMEKAQVLEAMGDKTAAGVYSEVISYRPDSQTARIAEARRARSTGNWAGAYKAYARALEQAPQDIQLLNELEYVRQQMRPQVASRGFANPQGERRPEEAARPWQFSRPDREFLGRMPGGGGVPLLQPETMYFDDHNGLYGLIVRASGSFRLTRAIPMQMAVEYREYNQNARSLEQGPVDLGLVQVYNQTAHDESRLRRLEVSLGAGPVALADRLRLSGEIIWRRYWKRVDRTITQKGQQFFPFPDPAFLDVTVNEKSTLKEQRDRLFGALQLDFPITLKTDGSLKYSRRDIFDQDAALFPRLYQSVSNLGDAKLVTYHQVEFSFNHQFRPGLEWRGNAGGAFFSDDNRRFTLYQGLYWRAVNRPRLQVGITPHYYLAAYRKEQPAYFSPHAYHALGLGFDFSRQIFRLPTLILQGTAQAVGQHGDWGPALHGLAALEWEMVHNFFIDPHVFYFREWVDDYDILTFGLSMRYTF
ncbi:MAG: tetratricopeptide repeat protein [Deltaproteobacteria bacterium]|nr:tetratricopeptide repeat protein [Deltaproteobacteria bacterium]